ncbi:MAG: hypothetical protein QNM02_18795 [Acidimicrobiia bacterium]|nr:hypothetical protein [Acidimicrobiia bacterium]
MSEPKNRADELSRRFIELFTAGEREDWLLMLSPDQVTRDRRPLVGIDTSGVDELGEVYPRDRSTRPLSSTIETVAARGDGFALVRWRATSGRGREWDSFHLTRWNADGLNVLNIIFPSDQLDEALAELDSLYQESLGDAAETTRRDG